jgi:DNA modification methylase
MKKIIVTCKGADVLPIDSLEEFQGNLKKLSKKNLDKLKKQILRNGFNVPFFVWRVNDWCRILDGHQRLKGLLSLRNDGYEIPLLPVAYIEAENEKDARQKLLGITSQYGEFEIEELNEWISDLDSDIADCLRFSDEELVIEKNEIIETQGDDNLDVDVVSIVRFGDIWDLNNHRLMCGDSTKDVEVSKLMNNNKIDLVFTDPPYGVSYADKNKFLNNKDNGNRNEKEIKNDHLTLEETKKLWDKTFNVWIKFLNDYSSYYICSPQGGEMFVMMDSMNSNNFILRHTIIWNKNNHVLGRCDYNYKHEPIFYGWSKKHKFYGNGKQKTSVWNFDKPLKNDLHPTMKPVDLVVNAIMNSTEKNSIVADFFLGSGTTLIASEKTERICYGMELDEDYCNVIIKRFVDWCLLNNVEIKIKRNGEDFNYKEFLIND